MGLGSDGVSVDGTEAELRVWVWGMGPAIDSGARAMVRAARTRAAVLRRGIADRDWSCGGDLVWAGLGR